MSETIVLSKIAKLAKQEQITADSKVLTFLYKNVKCILLDEFIDDAENILELMRHAENNDRNEIGFVSQGVEEHLVFMYKNRNKYKTDDFVEKLLFAVYPNLNKSVSSTSKIETKVLNTYVTSKLFDALLLKHKQYIQEMTNKIEHKISLPAKFRPTLREYQKKSILWLLKRELNQESFPLFEKLLAKDKETTVYKHLYYRFFQKEPPLDINLPPGGILADEMGLGKTVEMLALIILNPCCEVNLSPTLHNFFFSVSTKRICKHEKKLLCICNSQSKENMTQCNKCYLWQHQNCVAFYDDAIENDDVNSPYLCPSCWHEVIQEFGVLKTKATFIVSPNTIKMQWASEIRRHIQPTLRVFLYEGVLSGKWISPRQLAEYDIVLTDYNILRREIYYTNDNPSERTMRNKPRFMRVKTPILMLNWWRVVLDEAQMVESNHSKLAALVRMIPAVNRWAVTGTPIQKSLYDLQSLLHFIGFEAVSDPPVWHQIMNDLIINTQFIEKNKNMHFPAMVNILQKCMWRTCKTHIASELDIPPQEEIVHLIQFDNLEKLFYDEQHKECRSKFLNNVFKFRGRMSTISPQVMNFILQPFLKIRQSCTIPVVLANSTSSNNFSSQQHKQFLKPQELNDYLKSTNEISCKSELRAMASSHNGLAALYILQEKFDQAIKNYEAVLKLSNDYSDLNIAVDSLLQIHALYNIMQINILKPAVYLQKEIDIYENLHNKLEWKYLSIYASNLATVKTAYEASVEKVNTDILDNFIRNMADALETISAIDEQILMQKVRDECFLKFQNQENKIVKLSEIQSIRTLLYVVDLWFNKIAHTFRVIQNDIENLKYFSENVRPREQVTLAIWKDINQLVNSVYSCHLNKLMVDPKSKNEKKKLSAKKQLCKMCSIRDSINTFECLLFDKVLDKTSNFTEGLENHSFEMYLCKITFHYVKNKYRQLNNIMVNNWLYLENLQLVCKRLIKLWIEMEYTIKAYDELNMCKMRITLTDDVDDKSICKIVKNEIDERLTAQQNELMSAQNQFRIKLARLKYIRHLQGNDDLDPCPICQLTEDDRYAVLECGHHICFPCLRSMRLYSKGNNFKCSVCRNVTQNENIYYVSRARGKNADIEKINGNYSSKITYIVGLILKLQRQQNEECKYEASLDNNVKILIFSQWQPIIQAIGLALKENDITYRAQCTPKTIEEFKDTKLGITCLLMPFEKGSKGLNLVEATHVFLVEPILNPGDELQAIGRVHRFGQTKKTIIHRFIVNRTIEENIYNFIISSPGNSSNTSSVQSKWEFDNITLMDFENLFSLPQINEIE